MPDADSLMAKHLVGVAERLLPPGEARDKLSAAIAEAVVAEIAADRDALRAGLAAAHREVYEWGHRPGDHFDECAWCALIHGSGYAYPKREQPR